METIHNVLRHHAHRIAFALSCIAGLILGSCAEEDLGNRNGGDKDVAVTFNVSSAQDNAQQAAAAKAMPGMPVTRAAFSEQLGMMNLTPENLTSHKLAAQGAADLCLIETTTAGIDEIPRQAAKGAPTRANITQLPDLGHFSSCGYRGTTAGSISSTAWFYNKDTNPNGTLVSPMLWAWGQPFGKFYAVYPQVTSSYTKLTMSPESHTSTPYVDFEVEPDVKNQKDLMTACSGVVHYATQFVAPTTNLKFRHALTAVRFKVGQNLSLNKTITKVEIIGAKSKGRYTLATDENGTDAAWSNLDAPKTFTLGGDGTVNVSTSEAVNNIIIGKAGDNYTFYMIPQSLSGVQVKVYFDNSPTPAITANLAGSWKAGTTKTYALSQNTSTWNYTLSVTSPTAAEYNATSTDNYTIQSYRTDPATSTQQAVKWKVVGYDVNGDGVFTMSEKPTWLSLSKIEGDGGTTAESNTGTLITDYQDFAAERNAKLKAATPLGSSVAPYDLSMHNYKGDPTQRNTANSYLISAPGWYKIPLVYGNAITNGATNSHAYISQAPTGTPNEQHILRHFRDHAGQNITDPWITQSNGGANAPDAAKLVWADESGIVNSSSLQVTGSGTNAYVQFEVPTATMTNGNAVIAVTRGGVVVWSWHLWFAPKEVLNTTEVTNAQSKKYKFANETLGWKYTTYVATNYSSPRSVKVKVEQSTGQVGNIQTGIITITQNNYRLREGYSALYQWGRKDAFPGVASVAEGSYGYYKNGSGSYLYQDCILHPETMIYALEGTKGYGGNPTHWSNLWSMDHITRTLMDDPVVKTIYDPCPAGFKMPESNAFTGFMKGSYTPNASGTWDNGWNFNNKLTAPDATIYIPVTGLQNSSGGYISNVGMDGWYWTVGGYNGDINEDYQFYVSKTSAGLSNIDHDNGLAVRPIFDE